MNRVGGNECLPKWAFIKNSNTEFKKTKTGIEESNNLKMSDCTNNVHSIPADHYLIYSLFICFQLISYIIKLFIVLNM